MLRFTKRLLNIRPSNFPKFFSSREHKEVFDYRREEHLQIEHKSVNCLVLHPVLYPKYSSYQYPLILSKGPVKELYLAEEAVGLAKALDWNVL